MADGHFPEVPLLLHYFYFYSFPISNTTKREKVPQLINANSWKFSPCFILSHQCHDHNFHLSVSSFFFMPMQYHLPEVLFSCFIFYCNNAMGKHADAFLQVSKVTAMPQYHFHGGFFFSVSPHANADGHALKVCHCCCQMTVCFIDCFSLKFSFLFLLIHNNSIAFCFFYSDAGALSCTEDWFFISFVVLVFAWTHWSYCWSPLPYCIKWFLSIHN